MVALRVVNARRVCEWEVGEHGVANRSSGLPSKWHIVRAILRNLRTTAAALLVVACGGKAVIDGEPIQEGTGAGDASSVSQGGYDFQGATQGSGGDAAADGGGGAGGGLAEGCPPALPEGGACAPDGLMCDYGGFCNSATCEGGTWQFPIC
jgi:hypothetical protein